MVEFSTNHPMATPISDVKADVMAMGNAFRAASDDDTRNVMTAMTNQTPQALESLKFYVVTKSWFVRAWPLLTAKPNDDLDETAIGDDLRDHIGKIQNEELVLVESKVKETKESSNDETNQSHGNPQEYDIDQSKQNINEYYRRIASENPDTTKMKAGLVHTQDYFFLGPSAWMLVKEKFGFDGYEISRSCKTTTTGRIEIALLAGEETKNGEETYTLESTIVPLSGRFPYEKVFPNNNNNNNNNNAGTKTNSVKSQRAAMLNEMISRRTEEKDNAPQPILLLPPSTTSYRGVSQFDDTGPLLGPPENSNMEVETGENGYDNNVVQVSGRKRLSSGLSNMGNTCFMNSTLQCLANTESLRRYFLSGEYKKDLNRENPLGTGGELATQFASLLGEMWGDNSYRRNVLGGAQSWKYSNSSNAVYPRNFKNSLGKHAEQFMGYDQHDSQELATYLLDALHEDTNRITKKPYVEKPEQGENESDALAADKAWEMHLRREDSRVLESFMGQVKSRLECCEENCTRVSTTFDPFMYLSVPIPGEDERVIEVTFVPIDPDMQLQKLSLTVSKMATIEDMLNTMNEELVKNKISMVSIPLEDLAPVEVYEKEIFKWHALKEHVDKIKGFDQTFVYELHSLEEVREAYCEEGIIDLTADLESKRKDRIELDEQSRAVLDKGEQWKQSVERFSTNRISMYRILNPTRSTTQEKIEFLSKLEDFLDVCYLDFVRDETSGSKRMREGADTEDGGSSEDLAAPKVIDRASLPFSNVNTKHDLGLLEFFADKLRQYIVDLMEEENERKREGIVVQLAIRQSVGPMSDFSTRNESLCNCLVLRLPRNLSVYGLRKVLARRLSRSLIYKPEAKKSPENTNSGEQPREEPKYGADSEDFEIKILETCILAYDNKGRGSTGFPKPLGMINEDDDPEGVENGDKMNVAIESNEKEQVPVANSVNNRGRIYLYLGQDEDRKIFDGAEFDSIKLGNPLPQDAKPNMSVLDCIENYCKKEQLEESEMWYCNQCKKHVRAWKQFHLYRTPPILIIHLKRFFFSASTHRRDKITRLIDFPLKGLDLTDIVSSYDEDEKPIYDCYAVSNHMGGLGGGHYTAYTLSDDGMWCNYDDSHVTTDIDPEDVVDEAAYVLYYRRRDVPVGEDRNIILDAQMPPMVCEPADVRGEASEMSSNNTAQAGDMDMTLDDTDSNGSSKTSLSPMEAFDNNDHNVPNRIEDFTESHPLQ